jgi:FixJ family two-component response regulator
MNKNPYVFIVDDDPDIRDALSLIISQEDIPVRAFSNGHDFLAAFSEDAVGCAIIDLKMPEMDGIELQKAMLELQICLPIIFLTGYGDIPTSVKAIKNGAVNFLTKPVNADDLLTSIRLAILESLLKVCQIKSLRISWGSVIALSKFINPKLSIKQGQSTYSTWLR